MVLRINSADGPASARRLTTRQPKWSLEKRIEALEKERIFVGKQIQKYLLLAVFIFIVIGFYRFLIYQNTYPYVTALKNGDVVMGAGGVANVEKLYTFIDNLEHDQADSIQITAYSKEGSPSIFDLEFDGILIKCTSDNTRDRYGITLFKEYGEYTKVEKNERKDYFLIDETGKYEERWIFQE